MAKRRKAMKSRAAMLRDAMARGIETVGGLARAVYGVAPRDRRARVKAAKLRYYALHTSEHHKRSASC